MKGKTHLLLGVAFLLRKHRIPLGELFGATKNSIFPSEKKNPQGFLVDLGKVPCKIPLGMLLPGSLGGLRLVDVRYG